jgi:AbrB family looped-hinge helix DNA binding protein
LGFCDDSLGTYAPQPYRTTTVSSKGQVVLPAELRQQDGIKPEQEFEVERIECGEYRLKRVKRRRNEGLVDWLLRCPENSLWSALRRLTKGY